MYLTREKYYDNLIEMAHSRIENIKNLPYYSIFGREQERQTDIQNKQKLIIYLKIRKNGRTTN